MRLVLIIATLYVLMYLQLLAHEYGHVVPHARAGYPVTEVQAGIGPGLRFRLFGLPHRLGLFPLGGASVMGYETPPSNLSFRSATAMYSGGPIAGLMMISPLCSGLLGYGWRHWGYPGGLVICGLIATVTLHLLLVKFWFQASFVLMAIGGGFIYGVVATFVAVAVRVYLAPLEATKVARLPQMMGACFGTWERALWSISVIFVLINVTSMAPLRQMDGRHVFETYRIVKQQSAGHLPWYIYPISPRILGVVERLILVVPWLIILSAWLSHR